jgi:DUF4097 and DUF4098 domain-containing protein YvlB
MPTFHTPEPIHARVDAASGSVRLVATDRDETVVQVRARDESRPADLRAAEQTQVECRDGRLTVSAGRRGFSLFRGGVVDIDIALPAQSRLQVSVASADVRAEGEFADCRISSASGNLDLGAVHGMLNATTASGSITVRAVAGDVTVATASGSTTVGELDGDVKFKAASGDLSVARLCGDLRAQTASGSVTVASAVSGAISVSTSSGQVAVGIGAGTAARLDLITASGVVTNLLEPFDGPGEDDDTLLIRARTASGDINIHRAVPTQRAAT